MDPVALIVPQALRGLLAFGARLGARGRHSQRLELDSSPIPLAFAGQLLEELADETFTEGFGLAAGAASRFEDAPLAREVRGSPTVGSALASASAVSARYCGGQRLEITTHGASVRVQRRFPDSLRRGRRQANDFALQMLIELVRRGAGAGWRPAELHIEGPAPGHAEEIAALSAGSTHFGARADCLVLSPSVLALRLPPTPGSGSPGSAPLPDVDFVASVRETIRSLLDLGRLSVPNVAEAAGTSVRSLQRCLAAEGLRFTRMVDEARFEAASRLLRDSATRITDVSFELGYTDAANFTRAFHRWSGASPQDFRRATLLDSAAGAE
jgi:AraC-like DNA-binding protein